MRICKTHNIIVGLIFLLIILPSSAYPQQNRTAAPPPKIQGEIATDSNTYIIGPEDVLHIYIW
jgi:hypothetical protein